MACYACRAMRILFLTHSFNSLSQRLFVELRRLGHEVSIEFDIHDDVTREAVAWYRPELVIAPFLKRAIPESVWRSTRCWIVHPGPVGDRGPAALDWAIEEGVREWGVTVLQADAEMDAGDVWASVAFPMRAATKSSLYRREVTDAAVQAVRLALERLADPAFRPLPLSRNPDGSRGRWRPALKASQRAIDWQRDDRDTVLRRIRAADGFPGVHDEIFGLPVRVFGAWPESRLRGEPGAVIATRNGAICRATRDGAVWITHLRPIGGDQRDLKLPAVQVLGQERLAGAPELPLDSFASASDGGTWQEIHAWTDGDVGYLAFEFHNGAMAAEQCGRLREAWERLRATPARVLVLLGGSDFWSNGIHLHRIEAAEQAAEASWENIEAMNDLTRAIIETDDRLVVSALRGNAGAGGVFLALAADEVWCAPGVVLNPHYKNMGNLYGSEYWTYLLPRRVGPDGAQAIMTNRLPLGAPEAREQGLVDAVFGSDAAAFFALAQQRAQDLAASGDLPVRVQRKRAQRRRDEAEKPLAAYREEEMQRMHLNFFGFDPSYHVARYNFVHRVPHSRTPLHLALHRRRGAGTRVAHAARNP
ncbi:Hydrogenase assembly protein HoxX [Thioalkalivibrio nitratireducens DSM 14787]|uniref:Hydrogenase assembly protein HoxX n=1 Tax=Thioalkalivibrio nitratireducens (strain DSM 14787 / UNIQEM 213 / ALEN2) TaxID=1255043 RepID=L0DVH8_THIND|nr:enoyl-CoA hydratase-related protein [Thioalkalivibrio nitratireducens]AGA32985.1 Hydrogenase assembly protein HoxX [Thioalkalivibrio nitratireducens DSM 14787]